MAAGKSGWGGARRGAGRPRGTGRGASSEARRNRVAVMLTDRELARLRRSAARRGVPVATLAYELLAERIGALR